MTPSLPAPCALFGKILHGPEGHPGHDETAGERMPAGVPRYSIEAGRVHPVHPQGRLRSLYGRWKELRRISGTSLQVKSEIYSERDRVALMRDDALDLGASTRRDDLHDPKIELGDHLLQG